MSLLERAFKIMKNGVYFIVIALLVAELFTILIYARLFLYRTETFTVLILITIDMAHCVISMATQWAPGPLHRKGKIRVSLPNKGYLLAMCLS